MDAIVSIRYDKHTSEFCIKRRNTITAKTTTTYANHLTEDERIFAKAGNFSEDEHAAHWTI